MAELSKRLRMFEGVIAMLNSIIHGDCLEVLTTLEDNSVDSIVTDPPYELGFMGKSWDSTGIAYNVELWKECLRVLKPGGHLLAFGGTRTYHRMACAIEDAGFEIRDCIQWLYGSGFPKSHDISKAIDRMAGVDRKVIGKSDSKGIRSGSGNYVGDNYKQVGYDITIPATPEAQKWEGWGTALKPANEPIVLARKPISEKTVAENVLKWGTGGLNIDGCRLVGAATPTPAGPRGKGRFGDGGKWDRRTKLPETKGRFPANVILDEEAGRMLDEQTGTLRSGFMKAGHPYGQGDGQNVYGKLTGKTKSDTYGDSGGASRFFYCAKASKNERGEGNNHPTVKPIKLMEYLVTLITPPNGIVLDPFIGSGTTAIAVLNTGRYFIGIEKEKKYFDIAKERIANHTISCCSGSMMRGGC